MKPSGLRWVIGEAEVTKVDERQIEFTVRATEGAKEVGASSHSRVVIDMAKFKWRLRRAMLRGRRLAGTWPLAIVGR